MTLTFFNNTFPEKISRDFFDLFKRSVIFRRLRTADSENHRKFRTIMYLYTSTYESITRNKTLEILPYIRIPFFNGLNQI